MPRSFLRELKRRHVYRVAAMYAVVGWLLIQIATQVFPFFRIPGWSVRLLVLLVLAGFPVAIVLAWAFDATPHGIVRTEQDGQAVLRRGPRGTLAVGVIGILIALAAGIGYWRWHAAPEPVHPVSSAPVVADRAAPKAGSTAVPDLSVPMTMAGPVAVEPKSIAVLPFENLSADPGNRYFAEGMQDMILTRLADIGDLKVISRTSTEKYASRPENLKDVARQLAVANILEGSVQKSGNQVLINVQLIDAATDDHLWAHAYVRTLDNIFGVEGEVAQQIAQALHATLSDREMQSLALRPTSDVDAYNAYLRGLASDLGAGGTAQDYRRTAGFYGEAVKRDPDFALAWARLAEIDSRMYQRHIDRGPALAAAASHAAGQALKLAPDSGEAWLAQGTYYARVESDDAKAITALTKARQRLPNSGEVLAAFSDVEAREGQWSKAIEDIDQTSIMDPRNARLLLQHVRLHGMRREFKDASAVLQHALAVAPDDVALLACNASLAQALGQLDQAGAELAPLPLHPDDPSIFRTRIMQWLYQHQYSKAIAALQAALQAPGSSSGNENGEYWYLLGFAQQLAGDAKAAGQTWTNARAKLLAMQRSLPREPAIAADVGLVDAGLGDKQEALAEADRAMQLQPASVDRTLGPGWQEQRARVEAQTGDSGAAIADLAQLLQTPYRSAFYITAVTPSLLREDPTWNPLRDDPRFRALLSKPADATPTAQGMVGPSQLKSGERMVETGTAVRAHRADAYPSVRAAANASRVRFTGSPSVHTTSSSMRMPPYLRKASTFGHTTSFAAGLAFNSASSMSMK